MASLEELPGDVLLAILQKLDHEDRVHASRAGRCLRLASCALEWRVRLDLRDEPDPDPRLRSFVEWATGGPAGRPRNVTRLRLAHQVVLGASGDHLAQRLPCRNPPGPGGHHGSPMSLACLSAIPTLASLDLAVCHPRSLAGIRKLTSLRQLRVVAPIGAYFATSSVCGLAFSHETASQVLGGSLVSLQGLVSLELSDFLDRPCSSRASSPFAWLQRLTQLTHLKVKAMDARDAVWALPRLEHLHVQDIFDSIALPKIVEKLSLGSSQLSRLTLETCSLCEGHGALASSVRELELLKCADVARLVSALAPSAGLTKLSVVCGTCEPLFLPGMLQQMAQLSGVRELQMWGWFRPSESEIIVKLPHLRTLRLGLYSVRNLDFGSSLQCFTHVPNLKNLVLEVPEGCGSIVPVQELSRGSPQGCEISVRELATLNEYDGEYEDDPYEGYDPPWLYDPYDSESDDGAGVDYDLL